MPLPDSFLIKAEGSLPPGQKEDLADGEIQNLTLLKGKLEIDKGEALPSKGFPGRTYSHELEASPLKQVPEPDPVFLLGQEEKSLETLVFFHARKSRPWPRRPQG